MKKIEETKQAIEAWSHCRTSKYLFDRISQCFNEAKQKFDLVITTTEELEMCIEESVWISDYEDKKAEIEEYYSRSNTFYTMVTIMLLTLNCEERD